MKKLSTTIIFTLMALFATSAHAFNGANPADMCGSAAKVMADYKNNPQAWKNRHLYTESRKATVYFQANCRGGAASNIKNVNMTGTQTGMVHPATCKDCYNAGYRKGIAAGHLEASKRFANSSSVTNPLRPARTVYVNHKTHAPKPSVPTVKHKAPMVKHAGHKHKSEAERLDCELTDALNRQAGPVTTVIKRTTSHNYSKVKTFSKLPMVKHGGHSHHTEAEKADCALTDALNRKAGPVVTVLRSH